MFSKALVFALLSVSLCALTAQAAPAVALECSTVSVLTVTRTVTAASTSTSGTSSDKGNSASKSKNLFNNGGKSGNGGSTGASSGSSTNGSGSDGSTTTATSTSIGGAASSSVSTNNAATGGGSTSGNSSLQTSLTLDPSVIAPGFAQNGQGANGSEAGQVASLTSTNNFINFCASVNQPITNGQQITSGSCNPAPMGQIPSTANMPSTKFSFPENFGTVQANTAFTISMNIQGLETGNFVNAESNYFAAPQQLNSAGQIVGHSHVVVEQIDSLTQTTPTNPQKFAFFKGLNAAAQGGVLTAAVTSGLPAGVYKLSSINTAANHQPCLVPIAQHGSLDDVVYFTVTDSGAPATNSTASASAASLLAVSTSSVAASSSVAALSSATVSSVAASSTPSVTSISAAKSAKSASSNATAKPSAAVSSSTAVSSIIPVSSGAALLSKPVASASSAATSAASTPTGKAGAAGADKAA